MSKPWFRCFPSNFLLGTAGMRPILFKAYTRLLMGMYDQGGPLSMKPAPLARLLEMRHQDVGRLLAELEKLGKIEIRNGVIHNKRTDHELRQLSPTYGLGEGLGEASPKPQVEPHQGVRSGEKPNGNYTRAHDHTRGHARPATQNQKERKSGAPGLHDGPRAAPPTLEVSATAPEANKEKGSGSGDNIPRRRTADWDMPAAPGPKGQTKFLQAEAAFKAGDKTALDPLPGVPWSGINPALAVKIRTQLGLPLPEDNHAPPADQDDHGFAQRHERAPDPEGFEAYQAGPRNGDPEASSGEFAAKYADPGNPDDETEPPLSDDFFGGLP